MTVKNPYAIVLAGAVAMPMFFMSPNLYAAGCGSPPEGEFKSFKEFMRHINLRKALTESEKNEGEPAQLSYTRNMKENSFNLATEFAIEYNTSELIEGSEKCAKDRSNILYIPQMTFPQFDSLKKKFVSHNELLDTKKVELQEKISFMGQAEIKLEEEEIKLLEEGVEKIKNFETFASNQSTTPATLRYVKIGTTDEVGYNLKLFAAGKFDDTDSTEGAGQFSFGLAYNTTATADISPDSAFLATNLQAFNIKWETDQDFDTTNLVIGYNFVPTGTEQPAGDDKFAFKRNSWGFGILSNFRKFNEDEVYSYTTGIKAKEDTPEPVDKYFRFRLTPIATADFVTKVSDGLSNQQDTSALRIPFGGKLEIFLPFMNDLFEGQMEALGLRGKGEDDIPFNDIYDDKGIGTKFFVENTLHYTPNDRNDDLHNYLDAGFVFPLSDTMSWSATYRTGQLAPAYRNIETFKISFGAKF